MDCSSFNCRSAVARNEADPLWTLNFMPLRIMIPPGLSSVPANHPASIIVDAPAASALVTSPGKFVPPSAITGTPDFFAAVAARIIAVNCGTPTPATMRVVHNPPGPIPILTASTPHAIRSLTPSGVATLPPIRSMCLYFLRMVFSARSDTSLCPCATSTTITSTPASRSACVRSR